MSVNKATIIGNVGKEPQIRQTNDGKEIASFSVATSESWKDKNTGEKKESTEWHNIVIFSQGLVGIVKNYVKKGSKLYIEGQIKTRKWADKQGVDKYTTEIVIQGFNGTLQLLNKVDMPDAHSTAKSNGYQPQQEAQQEQDFEDEIPF